MLSYRSFLFSFRRSYYLAHRFQPKTKRKVISYDDSKIHPADRLLRTKPLPNVLPDGSAVDIGFKCRNEPIPPIDQEHIDSLDEKSRSLTLQVDLEYVFQQWQRYDFQKDLMNIFRHYAIFADLFEGAEFSSVAPLKVRFTSGSRAFFGNVIAPREAEICPEVSVDLHTRASESAFYWSVILTCPDEHLTSENGEYLHWAACNIPSNASSSDGVELCPYLQPIPYRGTGFHRYVFLAFHHKNELKFDKLLSRKSDCLSERTFSTHDFYKSFEEDITPISLSFFQSLWDESVTQVFHDRLGLKEPGFEFDAPPHYTRPFKERPRHEDLSYIERYEPGLWMRYDHSSYEEGSWDKLWNTADYKVAESLDQLEPSRLSKVWRDDVYSRIWDDKNEYENQVSQLLKKYKYQHYQGENTVLPGKLY